MEKLPISYTTYYEGQTYTPRPFYVTYQSTGSNGSPGITHATLPRHNSSRVSWLCKLFTRSGVNCIQSSDIAHRVLKWSLLFTSLLQIYAGLYLMIDQLPDLAGSFAGFFVCSTAIVLLIALVKNSLAVIALVQVFTVSFQFVIAILILVSLYYGLRDDLLIGLYVASLFCFILESILIREYLAISIPLEPYNLLGSFRI